MDLHYLTEEIEHISQNYAKRFQIMRDPAWFLLKLHEEVGELTQCYLMLSGQARVKGNSLEEIQADLRKEIADVVCQALLLAKWYEIDIEQAIEEKWLVWNKQHKAEVPSGTEDTTSS